SPATVPKAPDIRGLRPSGVVGRAGTRDTTADDAVNNELAVRLEGITKRFPGVIANKDVSIEVAAGEIHALCGENGAGKSTLMKILYGMQKADEGRMFVNGEEVHFDSPTDAIAAGIGMVHQHFMLA